MTLIGLLQIVIVLAIVGILMPPLGNYMAKVFQGERVFLSPVIRPLEVGVYKLSGVREDQEQRWTGYLLAVMLFSVAGLLISYAIMRLQAHLPLNPDGQSAVNGWLSFNTAVSFTTNTNWQNYGGESTMSYLSQMLALATHNFMSAAMGIAVAVAVVRAFARQSMQQLGSFWVDVTRCTLYVLLPISIVVTLLLVAQGVPQTLGGSVTAKTLEGAAQTIARGPVASQEVIKELGTNGGGFFNTNSAHPFENPSPLTNVVENVMLLAIPFALAWMFGRMVGSIKQGLALAGAMLAVMIIGIAVGAPAEKIGNPAFTQLDISQASNGVSPGGNMEGKEVRNGPILSALWMVSTTNTSTGAVNSFHDSFTPLGGLVALVNMELGEITPGGVGSGLYGILIFAVVSVFIAGLMVGRTPEYLGKKIQGYEIKMASLAILITPLNVLAWTGLSVLIPKGVGPILNPGPHGLSEILYAFSSFNGNNGSAFAGLGTNTNYYNLVGGLAMFTGRFIFLVPIMALAGSLVAKRKVPESAGTFPTDSVLFSGLLVGVILIVGALTFFPALSLGPIVEHLRMVAGQLSG
jgi:potassium-transporting ATPase potassium-binding subunit